MSKRVTRRQRGLELLKTLSCGPAAFDDHPELKQQYQIWVTTWILPVVVGLVRELKGVPIRLSSDWQAADFDEALRGGRSK